MSGAARRVDREDAWITALVLLYVIVCFATQGCASQRSAESHADYVANVQTTRTEGAERVTVLEFAPEDEHARVPHAPGAPRRIPSSVSRAYQEAGRGQATLGELPPNTTSNDGNGSDLLPPHGPLLKATITDRAPIITETHSGTEIHSDAESASSRHLGPGFWGWVGLGAGAALALALAWRFRLGLASGVLRVLGRG